MAHRSRKKHIKHLHQHEPETAAPAAKKHAGAKADLETGRVPKSRAPAKAARSARTARTTKKRGIIGKLARAASTSKKLASPKRVISRAKSRVKSLLHRG